MTDAKILEARVMCEDGMTLRAIDTALGVAHGTVRYALNPVAREKNRLTGAEWNKDHREQKHVTDAEYTRTHKEERAAYVKDHLPEFAAYDATRKAKILGATVGDPEEIKAIYRRAASPEKVRCYLCSDLIPLGHRHVDHIFAVSKGGPHRPSNLAVTCDKCNLKKKDKLPEEVGILL